MMNILKIITLGAISLMIAGDANSELPFGGMWPNPNKHQCYELGEPEYQIGRLNARKRGRIFKDKKSISYPVMNRMIDLIREDKNLSDKEKLSDIYSVKEFYAESEFDGSLDPNCGTRNPYLRWKSKYY